MNLSLISFVGVDKKTSIPVLESLSMEGVDLEFSVLYSEGRKGGRYSTIEFCRAFLSRASTHKGSLHLCGKAIIDKFLSADDEIMALSALADRVQLNFAMRKHDEAKLIEGIFKAMDRGIHVILQLNKSKAAFVEKVKAENAWHHDRLSLLHDSSGGFGRVIKKVSPPDREPFTGYAGGIKPENVREIVSLIEGVNTEKTPYYIDMESGVRAGDNIFSLEKCELVISEISK